MNVYNLYLDILVTNHKDLINDIIRSYRQDTDIQQIFTYFRIFYMYNILTEYVYEQKLSKEMLKTVLIKYFDRTVKMDDTNKEIMKKNLSIHFDYMYKIFFIDHNIYFSIYFNNLIKYFLPVPFDIVLYSPILTYRSNVNSFYKKNNIDYLTQITPIDTIDKRKIIAKRNIDAPLNEIDIHIPIKFFKPEVFSNMDVIYMFNEKSQLYIAKGFRKIHDNIYEASVIFHRVEPTYNYAKYNLGVCFELLSELWVKKELKVEINFDNVSYISVNKKIIKQDIFNVFKHIDFKMDDYRYLYHNTGIKDQTQYQKLLNNPTFFFLAPMSHIQKYFKDRKCISYTIKKDINDLLDLTQSITTSNIFTEKKINDDREAQKWISYDNLKTHDYYKGEPIATKFHENNKCITSNQKTSIENFIKERPYCDINSPNYYVGRRKLQEIFFKTRKYAAASIWYHSYFKKLYEKVGCKLGPEQCLYHDQYHKCINMTDYDTYFLQQLDINGFFFTNYDDQFNAGGEILLTNPSKYVQIEKIGSDLCSAVTTFSSHNKNISSTLSRDVKNKGVYVNILTDPEQFLGALVVGWCLIKTKSHYSTIVIISKNIPNYQKKILSNVFGTVLNMETEVFTNNLNIKLEVLKLDQYDKVILLENDILISENIDDLFDYKLKKNQKNHSGVLLLSPNEKKYNELKTSNKSTVTNYLNNHIIPADDRIICFNSKIKPWRLIYKNRDSVTDDTHNSQYYELWFMLYKELDKKFNLSTNFLTRTDKIDDVIKSVIKKIIVYPEYYILNKNNTEFVTTVDIINIMGNNNDKNNIETINDKIKKIINNLPEDDITFLYITSGTYIDLLKYFEIKLVNGAPQLKTFDKENILKYVEKLDIDEFTRKLLITDIENDPLSLTPILYNINKKRITKNELFERSPKINTPAVIHYAINYDNHFIYFDIAVVDTLHNNDDIIKDKSISIKNAMKLYNDEYCYVANELKKIISSSSDNNELEKKICSCLTDLIENIYGMYSQIATELYYLYYISKNNSVKSDIFVNHLELLIDNLEKMYYISNDRERLLSVSKSLISSLRNKILKYNSEKIYSFIIELYYDIIKFVNREMGKKISTYIKIFSNNPKYSKLFTKICNDQ